RRLVTGAGTDVGVRWRPTRTPLRRAGRRLSRGTRLRHRDRGSGVSGADIAPPWRSAEGKRRAAERAPVGPLTKVRRTLDRDSPSTVRRGPGDLESTERTESTGEAAPCQPLRLAPQTLPYIPQLTSISARRPRGRTGQPVSIQVGSHVRF